MRIKLRRAWPAIVPLWGITYTALAQTPSPPWIATSEPVTILSANDG